MNHNNEQTLLTNTLEILDDCAGTLTKLTTTCCMPERSSKMNAAFDTLTHARNSLQEVDGNQQQQGFNDCVEHITRFGGHIGSLYVSCCTETREPLYQHLFQQLQQAHTKLGMLLGHSH